MKEYKRVLRRTLVVVAAISCLVLFTGGSVVAAPVAPELDEEFTLAIGQVAVIEGEELAIRFDRVADDSRCPASVNCIWEGNARIVLTVFKPGNLPAKVSLNTNAAFPTEAEYLGYDITLVRLEPYPATTRPIPAWRYRATLVVEN